MIIKQYENKGCKIIVHNDFFKEPEEIEEIVRQMSQIAAEELYKDNLKKEAVKV